MVWSGGRHPPPRESEREMAKVTYEESQKLLRAPFRSGTAAKGYSGLTVGQSIRFRTYPNDPGYAEIAANGLLFTESWDAIEGFTRDGIEL